MLRPWTQLSASPRTIHVRWKSFLDHVDQAAPRAPRWWTTARPRKGTTRSRGRHGSGCTHGEEYAGSLVRLRYRCRRIIGVWVSGGMAWPAVGLVGGGDASAAAQPATGGRSRRHDRCCFGRLEQEDQRLKKHYGRWMDIVDHAAPRAPGRWTTARPTKGTTRSRGRHSSGCPQWRGLRCVRGLTGSAAVAEK